MAKSRGNNQADTNASLIRRVLQEEGFSDRAIRASLARMKQESNFNPLAINKNDAGPGKHSRGIFQWNRERLSALQNFARNRDEDWQSVETQARFFAHEARGSEKRWGSRLLAATTDEEAAKAAISMARPAGWKSSAPELGHGYANTLSWTKNLDVKADGPLTLYARDSKAEGQAKTDDLLVRVMDHLGNPELPSGRDATELAPITTIADDFQLPESFFDFREQDTAKIDNSPGAVFKQSALGLLSGVGAAMADVYGGGGEQESRPPSVMRDLAAGAPSPLSVQQIRSMIRV